jgi:hypothetical protein
MLSTSLRACWEGTANSLGFRVYLPDATSVFYAREGTANSLGFRVYLPDATSVFYAREGTANSLGFICPMLPRFLCKERHR